MKTNEINFLQYLIVLTGIIFSAVAQIMIKKSSFYDHKQFNFYLYFMLAGVSYLIAFGLYAYILKFFNLSKISPVMTIGTMICVICSSIVLFGEFVTIKQTLGILIGVVSIYLIIS